MSFLNGGDSSHFVCVFYNWTSEAQNAPQFFRIDLFISIFFCFWYDCDEFRFRLYNVSIHTVNYVHDLFCVVGGTQLASALSITSHHATNVIKCHCRNTISWMCRNLCKNSLCELYEYDSMWSVIVDTWISFFHWNSVEATAVAVCICSHRPAKQFQVSIVWLCCWFQWRVNSLTFLIRLYENWPAAERWEMRDDGQSNNRIRHRLIFAAKRPPKRNALAFFSTACHFSTQHFVTGPFFALGNWLEFYN